MRTIEPDRAEPGPDGPGDDDAPQVSWRRNVVLGLGLAAFLAIALFWLAIFTGKFTGTNPDTVHDAAWVRDAASACAPAADTIRSLPLAQTSKTASDRAATVDQGTDALATMVTRLGALQPAATDTKVVNEWVTDWRVYLSDRRAYAAKLRVDATAKPLVSERHGGWVTDAIDALALANSLPNCATPGDM